MARHSANGKTRQRSGRNTSFAIRHSVLDITSNGRHFTAIVTDDEISLIGKVVLDARLNALIECRKPDYVDASVKKLFNLKISERGKGTIPLKAGRRYPSDAVREVDAWRIDPPPSHSQRIHMLAEQLAAETSNRTFFVRDIRTAYRSQNLEFPVNWKSHFQKLEHQGVLKCASPGTIRTAQYLLATAP